MENISSICPNSSPNARRPEGHQRDELVERLGELELAAGVASRRAAAAEEEADVLRQQLAAVQQRASQLAWQVCERPGFEPSWGHCSFVPFFFPFFLFRVGV